jgi:hypothetical protein
MAKFIQYKRIFKIVTPKELEEELKKIVSDDLEIISYSEKILEKDPNSDFERIAVTILCGKINTGNTGKRIL